MTRERAWARPVLDMDVLEFAYDHSGLTPEEWDQAVEAGAKWTGDVAGYLQRPYTYGDLVYKTTGYTVILKKWAEGYMERRFAAGQSGYYGMPRDRREASRLLYTIKPAMRRGYGHTYYWLRDIVAALPPEPQCKTCRKKLRDWAWDGWEDDSYFRGLQDWLPRKHSTESYPFRVECCSARCGVTALRKIVHLRREQQWLTTKGRELLRRVKKQAREYHREVSKSQKEVSPRPRTSVT